MHQITSWWELQVPKVSVIWVQALSVPSKLSFDIIGLIHDLFQFLLSGLGWVFASGYSFDLWKNKVLFRFDLYLSKYIIRRANSMTNSSAQQDFNSRFAVSSLLSHSMSNVSHRIVHELSMSESPWVLLQSSD